MSQFREIVEKVLKEHNIILSEAKQVGVLYHNTPHIQEILRSNELKTFDSTGLYFDNYEGWFNEHPGSWHHTKNYYTLMLDGDKLSENYKIKKGYRTENEFVVIPPHQNPITKHQKVEKELNEQKNWLSKYYNIPINNMNEYIESYGWIDRYGNVYYDDDDMKKSKQIVKNFEKTYFNLKKYKDKKNLENFKYTISKYYFIPTKTLDLLEPLVIKNLNKYLMGLIVRYPFNEEIDRYDINNKDKKTHEHIQEINRNIKMFKGMYPNLPVYLRDEKGHKAVLKNNQIDQLPEIKTVDYPKNRLTGLSKNHEIAKV